MIIWDDYEYGKTLFEERKLKTKKWQNKELRSLCFYLLTNGFQKKEIQEQLTEICNDDIKYLTSEQRSTIFNKLITQCENTTFYKNITLKIYQEEIDIIRSVQNKEGEKLLFFMLVYKKWLNAGQKKNNNKDVYHWFACMKQDIFKESGLTKLNSKKRQAIILELIEKKYLFSEVKKLSRYHQKIEKAEKNKCGTFLF